jgi:ankyrin repeat protein
MLLATAALVAGCSNGPRNETAAKEKNSSVEAVSGVSEAEATALASTRAYLAAGGDPNAIEDAYGNYRLHNAARSGYVSVVKLLLEHGANIESRDSGDETPLVAAARSRSPQIVRILLGAGADVNAAGNFGSTAMHPAAAGETADCTEILALLLQRGAKTDKHGGSDRYTPLHWAAHCGLIKNTRVLLDAGASMEALDAQGDTPLHLAIMEQHFDVAKLLVARGAKLDLRSASGLGDLVYLRQNLKPACVNGKHEGWPGWTPLHYAAVGGQVKAVEFLLGQGADVDARGKSRDTPLRVAAENGHLEVARLLLDRGADVNAKDDSNSTPLHNAAWGCKPEVVRLLIDRGAAIEARNEWGRTPLSDAAEHGYISVVKLLLDKGANANSTDQYGFAPLYWASLELDGAILATPRGPSDFPETMRELKRHGARNPPDKQPPRSSK